MPSNHKEEWVRAVQTEPPCVLVRSAKATAWRPLERLDQQSELRRWSKGQPREKGWLILSSAGVPSHFVNSQGIKEPLRVAHPLSVVGYNILTSTPDGNPKSLSIFEQDLTNTLKKYRYWAHRRPLVSRALTGASVVGLCEATSHMIADVLRDHPGRLALVRHGLKVGEYDGSAILVDPTRLAVETTHLQALDPKGGATQIFLGARLRDRVTGARFWFVVLHLKSDGMGMHMSKEHVRVQQAERARRILDTVCDAPVIVVGDFNSDRLYHAACDDAGQRHVGRVLGDFAHALPLVPTYDHFHRAAFDYILVRGAVFVHSAHVPASGGHAPNALQGSDHLPVHADLVVVGPEEP